MVKRPVPNVAMQAPPIIKRNTVANLTEYDTGDQDGTDLGEDQGYEFGSTGDGRGALGYLKLYWDIISVGIVDHLQETSVKAADQHRSLAKDPRWRHSMV